MTDATTPVATPPATSTEALLERVWKVHSDTEDLITKHSLRVVATIFKSLPDDPARSRRPTGRARLTWEETANWAIEVVEDGESEWVDVYDIDESATDELYNYSPWFWEFEPSLLRFYTESGEVETDRHMGMLEEAIFLLDRMLLGPRTAEEQKALLSGEASA